MEYMTLSSMAAIFALMAIAMMAMPAIASDSSSMNPSVTIGNKLPVISGMNISAASYDPTESGNTTVTVYMNVTDANGVNNIEQSKMYMYVDDAATFASPVGKYTRFCESIANISVTTETFKCETDIEFYDAAGTYSTNITAGDVTTNIWNNTATNAPTFAYTTLVAATVDDAGISFGSVTLGVENQTATENPTTVTNTGNADLYMNITGADLTGTTYTFGIGNFSVSLDGTPTAEMFLTAGTQQITVNAVNAAATAGASSTEDLYWYVDVPSYMNPDVYTGTWILGVYEQ